MSNNKETIKLPENQKNHEEEAKQMHTQALGKDIYKLAGLTENVDYIIYDVP